MGQHVPATWKVEPVPASKTFGTSAIPARPDLLGPALAHVVKVESGKEVLLGQAWLAGPNQLVTCAHVVEQFIACPGTVVVKFPASGNRYAVQTIKLHPSFERQPDQLVKFDLAVLSVVLAHPETAARPLAFAFGQPLATNQSIATVRYPVHLGQLSSAPDPLAQDGRYLGRLRRNDDFHLLHDLALAPGDSGAAVFAGKQVVAIHCGDTATLPGLNLPTTSIRLALWVDALRELGIRETASVLTGGKLRPTVQAAIIWLVAALLTAAATCFLLLPTTQARWGLQQPSILPVDVSFNKALYGYKFGDEVQIVLVPRTDCWLYVFDVDEGGHVLKLYPPHGFTAFVKAGQSRTIDRFGSKLLKVNYARDKLHVVALNSDFPLVTRSDIDRMDPAGQPLKIDGHELAERIRDFKKADPKNVLHLVMDAPTAQRGN